MENTFEIDDLLEFINGGFPRHIDRQRAFWVQFMFSLDPEDLPKAQELVRSYVDEWIESGVRDDKSEWPKTRRFAPQVGLLEAVAGKPVPPSPSAVCAMARLLGSNEEPQIRDYGNGEMEYVVSAHGKFKFTIYPKGGLDFGASLTARAGYELEAANLFLEFYRSEWVFRLMKCRKCEIYAVPTRKVGEENQKAWPREQYVRGWHCPKCSGSASATASVEKSRDDRRTEWLGFAAIECGKWDAMTRKPSGFDKAQWIADQVNKKLPWSGHIKRQRITRNLNEIEEAARERNHAKS